MTHPLQRQKLYPVEQKPSVFQLIAAKGGAFGPIRCTVCDRLSIAVRFRVNMRESGKCVFCRSSNRNRQLAWVIREVLRRRQPGRGGLGRLLTRTELTIYNTECQGSVHARLAECAPSYICSEYLGEGFVGGEMKDGIRHEDLMALSLPDASVDIVLSSDVLEHVPDAYGAHSEIHRVLRPGGSHIFTVPFLSDRAEDEIRTRVEDGRLIYLEEPEYHGDPLRAGGSLVFRIFSLEMLVHLSEIGFETSIYSLHMPRYGIFGPGSLVFESHKTGSSVPES